jgi:hypothetical protein
MKIVDIRETVVPHQIQNFKRVHRFQPDDGQPAGDHYRC